MSPDDEPKDWEIRDEEPPERLEQKWFKESLSSGETLTCPHCKKQLPRDSITCVYCGGRTFYDSGPLGRILFWIRRLFS